MDSALFDLRQLDTAQLDAQPPASLPQQSQYDPTGSGLIDIKVLAAAQEAQPPTPCDSSSSFAPVARLVDGATLPPQVMPTNDRAMRRVLFATCLALLAVVITLAYEAIV